MNKINTFVTCLTKDGDNGHTLDVAQKSLGTRLPQYFDFVAYMQKFEENEKVQRALLFDSSDLNFCKSRSVKIEKYEKPNLGDIINKVFKES